MSNTIRGKNEILRYLHKGYKLCQYASRWELDNGFENLLADGRSVRALINNRVIEGKRRSYNGDLIWGLKNATT